MQGNTLHEVWEVLGRHLDIFLVSLLPSLPSSYIHVANGAPHSLRLCSFSLSLLWIM